MRGVVIGCSAAIALSGCVTAAQQQANTMKASWIKASADFQVCVTAVHNSEENQPLLRRMPVDLLKTSLEQQLCEDYINEEERAALFKIHERKQECRMALLEALKPQFPTVVPIVAEGFALREEKTIALIRREIAWGTFVKDSKAIGAQANAKQIEEGKRIDAGLNASHQAEVQQQMMALQAIGMFANAAAQASAASSGSGGGARPSSPPRR